MSLRLFVALVPPEPVVEHLEAAVAHVRRRWTVALRWTQPVTWHLTLAFFGEVAEERVPDLETRLGRVAARHDVLELRFRGAGAFSRPARARVLYTEVEADLPRLVALSASCGAAGRRIGLDLDDRPYRPHVTLARVKGREPVDVTSVVEELRAYKGPNWAASDLVLVRSYPEAGAHYESLASWSLRRHQA